MENKKRIFISYSRLDREPVNELVNLIEQSLHTLCWIDKTGIDCTREAWREQIMQAIEVADVVLFMHSANSKQSEFCQQEVIYAKNLHKQIMPILVDNTPVDGWVSWELGKATYINFNRDVDRECFFRDMSNLLTVKMSPADHQRVEQFGHPNRRPLYITLLVVLLCLVLGIAAYFIPWGELSAAQPDTPAQPQPATVVEPTPEPTPEPAPVAEPVQQTKPTSENRPATNTLSYARWEPMDGSAPLMGNGRLVFTQQHLIDSRDPQHNVAEPGDYVKGVFANGHLVQGAWYDANGNKKGFINIGQ